MQRYCFYMMYTTICIIFYKEDSFLDAFIRSSQINFIILHCTFVQVHLKMHLPDNKQLYIE